LHERQIYHRDIKPNNLFINADGKAVIGDFGLVKLPDEENLTPDGIKLGPHFFIAPEMLANADVADASKADVYSLAKSLWCTLAKQKFPIPGEHSRDFFSFWISKLLNDRELISLDNLFVRSMKIDPDKRISMLEFSNELDAFIKLGNKAESQEINWDTINKKTATEMVESNSFHDNVRLTSLKFKDFSGTIYSKFHPRFEGIYPSLKNIGLESENVRISKDDKTFCTGEEIPTGYKSVRSAGVTFSIFMYKYRLVFQAGICCYCSHEEQVLIKKGFKTTHQNVSKSYSNINTKMGTLGSVDLENKLEELIGELVSQFEGEYEDFISLLEKIKVQDN
jgi:serine/threonine protein kinase